MTREILYDSDLDDAKVLAALLRIEAGVDKTVAHAQAKFNELQATINRVGSTAATATAPATTRARAAADPVGAARPEPAASVAPIEDGRAQVAAEALDRIEQAERERFDATRGMLAALGGDERKRAAIAADVIATLRNEEQARSAKAREQIALLTVEERRRAAVAREQITALREAERQRAEAARQAGGAGSAEERARVAAAKQAIAQIAAQERARAATARQTIETLSAEERRRSNVARTEIAKIVQEENRRTKAVRQTVAEQEKLERQAGRNQAANIAKITAAYYLLARAIESVARQTVAFFANLLQESTRAAANIESVGVSFNAIFSQAGAGAGSAVLSKVREESKRLGTDLTGISRRILPLVESTDQLIKIGELISGLAALDPLQGVEGALVAINEALAGDVISLRRRFEIPTDDIKKLQDAKGLVDGLIEGLENELDVRGLGFDTLAETADITFKRVNQNFNFLREEFGRPILDELNEQFKTFLDFLTENNVQITAIVQSFGDLVAKVLELVGTDINAFFDEDLLTGAEEFIVSANEIMSLIGSITELLTTPLGGDNSFTEVKQDIFDLETALEALLKLVTITLATLQRAGARFEGIKEFTDDLVAGRITLEEYYAAINQAGDEAFAAAIEKGVTALENQEQAAQDATQALEDRKKALEENTDAEIAAADALLEANKAESALADAQAELAEKQTKVAEETAEATKKYEEDRVDAIRKAAQAQLDLEEETAQKRVDAARENAQKIADIFREHYQDIADANTDLSRDEQDILRKTTRKIEEIEQESADNRLEIEEEYQRELADIRRKFDAQAREAIRANDAVALLRIRRDMQDALEEAKIERDRDLQDEGGDREKRLQEERADQQILLEEARLAHQRKLEDLQLALARELEERQIAYARELEEINIAEQRKSAEIQKNLDRQLEELKINLDRKLTELKESLAAEVAAVQEAEAAKVEALRRANAQLQTEYNRRIAMARRAAMEMARANRNAVGGPRPPGSSDGLTPGGNTSEQLGGGDVDEDVGKPNIVPKADKTGGPAGGGGTRGFTGVGDATANRNMRFSAPPPGGAGSVSTKNVEVALSMLDPSQVNPTQLAYIRNFVLGVMQEATA